MRSTPQRFHFISGLPRSGSTLLAAILRQNPRFHAGMTSPVGSFFNAMMTQFSAGSEFASVVDQAKRAHLLRGLFELYYDDTGKELVFDTNRQWCAKMPALMELFPGAKVIACVRNVAWVMDSIERIYRANPFENTKLFGNMGRSSVYTRLEGLALHDQMVGFAWSALREAFYGEHATSLLVIDYDLLTRSPQQVVPLLYQFIGEPVFEHDFDNLVYDAPDFDHELGVPGLHKVRPRVEASTRRTMLPPDLFDKFSQMTFWTNPDGSCANIIAPQPAKP